MTTKNLLSPNFSLDEMIATSTIYRNLPDHLQLSNLNDLCNYVLEPARLALKNTILVTSGFRCKEVNDYVHGAKNSQHTEGKAADLKCYDNKELFEILKKQMNFDQLIWEFGDSNAPSWIHVSYNGKLNRRQILRAYKIAGMTIYKKML